MQITVELYTDNAAFDGREGDEVAAVLRSLADNLAGRNTLSPLAGAFSILRDVNGNPVGDVKYD